MARLLVLLILLPTLAWSQDSLEVYNAIFGEPSDPKLVTRARELEGDSPTTQNRNCDDVNTYPLSDTVKKLISDVENIVTDERMDEVNAPQSVKNQAIAKSKELVCAEIEMFVKTHNLQVVIDCKKRPQIIPPVHFQVVKFPGIVALKEKLEADIASFNERLQANPNDYSAQSGLRNANKDLACILERNTDTFNCRYLLEKNFSRGQGHVQVEIQDKSGQWYDFKHVPIDYYSGAPGPKTKQGDFQVPESRFKLTSVNPGSNYFSAVHIDYENWSSRSALLGDLNTPGVNKGGDVKMHGHGGSVGCLDLGNRGSPWVSAMVDLSLKRGYTPEIDIYPTDMNDAGELASWSGYEQYGQFWDEVKKRYWDTHGVSVRKDLKRADEMIEEIRSDK